MYNLARVIKSAHVSCPLPLMKLWLSMSFTVANNFIRSRGKDGLKVFCDLCNQGRSLAFIANRFNISIQRVSILRRQLFDRVWVYREATLDALKFDRRRAEHDLEDVDEMVESNKEKVRKIKTPIYEINSRA